MFNGYLCYQTNFLKSATWDTSKEFFYFIEKLFRSQNIEVYIFVIIP